MRHLVGVLAAIGLAGVFLAHANQQPPDRPAAGQRPPQFRAGVSLVRVDVYVNNKTGAVADLQKDDFEVYEDGVLQRIETFERIVARTGVPESERADLRSESDIQEALADPRNRLFVVFFDTLHSVGYRGGDQRPKIGYDPRVVGSDLARFLDRVIAADDVVAVMRPEMSLGALRFTRRPSRFDEFLLSGAEWQARYVQGEVDDVERQYDVCYAEERDIYEAMVLRRREMILLDALRGLAKHLGTLREGRKAILIVSEGWELFRPDERMARPLRGQVPRPPIVGIGKDRPGLRDPRDPRTASEACERDRQMLARLDNAADYRLLLDEANRESVTFYPIDLRGLTVEGTSNRRSDSLVTLATATDGVPVINTNSFTPALTRIHQDLASYYLLGYYATNTRADGRFRKIDVRVKRPGTTVRARRGYLAPTEREVSGQTRSTPATTAPDAAEGERAAVLRTLDEPRPGQPLRLVAGHGWTIPDGSSSPRSVLWVVGELDASTSRAPEWSDGADLSIQVSRVGGGEAFTQKDAFPNPVRTFLVQLADHQVAADEYLVRIRLQGKVEGAQPLSAEVKVKVPAQHDAGLSVGPAVLHRRGPYSGPRFVPTVDARFRRAERIRVDVPITDPGAEVSARLLDRRGHPLPVPVAVGQREEGRLRVVSAEFAAAPLALGDYLIEVVARSRGTAMTAVIAVRIVP